jgi:asparaginyl-tRNA synthetase
MQEKIITAKLENQVIGSMKNWLHEAGFFEIFPPKIVRASGACENVDTLFEIGVSGNMHWFCPQNPHKAYLSQTAQLYLEAFVPYLKKVYSVGPSFRAEEGADNRHLTEFMMMEIEFSEKFETLLSCIEKIIYKVVEDVLKLPLKKQKELGFSKEDVKRLKTIKPIFPKITYEQAVENLGISYGDDISRQNEQTLMAQLGNHPFFITHFPNPLFDHGKEIEVEKFFNMIPDPKNPKRVLSADLILPFGGEAVGAAQRVHNPEELKQRLKNSRMFKRLREKGGRLDDFGWYLEKIEKKSVPHSGCGFGIGRILKFLRGREDIRSVLTFPSNQECVI